MSLIREVLLFFNLWEDVGQEYLLNLYKTHRLDEAILDIRDTHVNHIVPKGFER